MIIPSLQFQGFAEGISFLGGTHFFQVSLAKGSGGV
jgi:hypothetical protein